MKEINSWSINQGNVQDRGSNSSADEDRKLKEYDVVYTITKKTGLFITGRICWSPQFLSTAD